MISLACASESWSVGGGGASMREASWSAFPTRVSTYGYVVNKSRFILVGSEKSAQHRQVVGRNAITVLWLAC
jgi:hypothetical protein